MMYRTERIFIVAALLTIGLVLVLLLSRSASGQAGSSDLLVWVISGVLVLVAAVGSTWLTRGSSGAQGSRGVGDQVALGGSSLHLPLDAVLPALLTAGLVIFLQLFSDGTVQIAVVALAALSFAALFWAQLHADSPADRYFSLAQSILNLTAHLTAFLLFSVLYGLKVRSIYSATAVGVVTVLLIYEMLLRDAAWHRVMRLPVEGRRTTLLMLSLVAGSLAAELTWGLNYWAALTTLVGGAFLLVVFYVLYGLLSHYVDRGLTRGTLTEFGVVGAVAVVAVFASAFFA